MEAIDRQYFELLKAKIVEVMQQTYTGINRNIEDWKGQEILEFQEDLQHKVNEYISEKWFYNHVKTFNDRLPRIDILNILSRYTGYADWSEFKHKNKDKILLYTEPGDSNKVFYMIPVIALIIFLLAMVIIKTGSVATYRFCFIDKDSKEPILNTRIDVAVLHDNESPMQLSCDSAGCFKYRTAEQKIKFLVNAPFYFPDTITRILNKSRKNEEIQLKINDYALMINYFLHSKVDDWTKRRAQLDQVIADSAFICQVFKGDMMGMELYNKTEFINLLTIPTSALRNIKIVEMLYAGEKITTIRFIQDYRRQ